MTAGSREPGNGARGPVGRAGPLGLISASTLLQELYWLRVFAEIEWSHVASMVVSTAMLGIGAGSVCIVVAGDRIVWGS